jgi:hypothetical protein
MKHPWYEVVKDVQPAEKNYFALKLHFIGFLL